MSRTIPFLAAALIALAIAPSRAAAQAQLPSRVDASWNRFYDYEEMTDLVRRLADAYPELLTLKSIGSSEQGRQLWLVILNNDATGPHTGKPAMWIDGNVHGNEVQSTETVLYSIWYLAKSHGHVPALTELIDRAAFYFVPSVNPDGRAAWFAGPNTPHSQRTGQRPTDNDQDGLLDEDGPEDLNGDGSINVMWRRDAHGSHRRSVRDPRVFERVEPGETGEWSFAGSEGIDNDGDGRVNEDGPGGYDMNRNWPSGWQPNHVQRGAGDHPFSFPETRAVGRFILDHPNIAAGQSYHNSGGMLLRGPGADFRKSMYSRGDTRVYDRLGEAGEEMLPFYRYMVIHADLYTVHGGFVNWLAEGLGICSFTNELWTTDRVLQDSDKPFDGEARMRWQDRVLFGQTFNDYTEYDHPQHGLVLIGGGDQYSSRTPPPFMLEEACHRNFAFTMFHAGHMPDLSFDRVEIERLDGDLWRVTCAVANAALIPTRLDLAASKKIGLPDRLVLAGDGLEVVASGTLANPTDRTIRPVDHRRHEIPVERGIPGEGRRLFRYYVTAPAGATGTLTYTAQKARDIEVSFVLDEAPQGE